MSAHDIGLDVDDLRMDVKTALARASALQFRCAEIGAVRGDVAAWNLSKTGRRHLARYAAGLGLQLSALTADVPGLRFTDPSMADERVARTLQVLEMARDMDVPVVTASVGTMCDPQTGAPLPHIVEALGRIGEYADARGRVFALRASQDAGQRLAAVLDEVRCPAVGLCLDPAALVMTGANPLAAAESLLPRVALFYARDATVGNPDRAGREVPLGEGEVDLPGVLAAVGAADYRGPYLLRRTDSQTPEDELLAARAVLLRLFPGV